jgi:hypothetical protein
MVKWGVQLVASDPPRAPGYYNMLISFFVVRWSMTRKLAYKKYLLIRPPLPQNKKVVEIKFIFITMEDFLFYF